MEITLLVVTGKANKNQIRLALPAVIGRSRQATLTIGHPKVSRQHCELFEKDGAVVVRDNSSLNGTLVNGRVVKECVIEPGEKLTVGPLTFMLMYEPAAAAAQPEVSLSINGEPAAPAADAGDVLPPDVFQEAAGPKTNEPSPATEEDSGTVELPSPAAVAGPPADPAPPKVRADDLLPPAVDDAPETEYRLDLPPPPEQKPASADAVVADTLATELATPKLLPPAVAQAPPAAAEPPSLQDFLRKLRS
ncbi:MAG: FHA domain-containing protein [Planctomycetia bacterium]|nr:FHA domain-containing protein [Planctomycetia bacterium]